MRAQLHSTTAGLHWTSVLISRPDEGRKLSWRLACVADYISIRSGYTCERSPISVLSVFGLVGWQSGRTSAFGRRTFPSAI